MDSEFSINEANAQHEQVERIFRRLVNGNACTICKSGPYQTAAIVRLDGKFVKSVGGTPESAKEWITTSGGTFVPYESLNAQQRRTVEGLA